MLKTTLKSIFLLILSLACYFQVLAGRFDSLEFRLYSNFIVYDNDYLPHYLAANHFGTIDLDNDGGNFRGAFVYPIKITNKFIIESGLDYLLKFDADRSYLHQAYIKINYGKLSFRAGKYEEIIGAHSNTLSSGAYMTSGNARPFPKLSVGFPEYVPVPLTFGYLEIKGMYNHGWLNDERYVNNPKLHEKWAYARAGGKLPVNIHAGFIHDVLFCGEHPRFGQLPCDFSTYMNVVLGKGGDDAEEGPGGENKNRYGSHLAIFDFGLTIKLKNLQILVYDQKPVEDKSGYKNFFSRNKDNLLGVLITPGFKRNYLKNILYEYTHTMYQSGPGLPDPVPNQPADNYGYEYGGRDDYYNNYLYRSGWTYHNRIIGNPLFFTYQEGGSYLGNPSDIYNNIINNRIKAHHIGFEGNITNIVSYRVFATFTDNYGTYAGLNQGRYNWESKNPDSTFEYEFEDGLRQDYYYIEARAYLNKQKNFIINTGIAVDHGELTKNTGVMIGMEWKLTTR